jgi:hypothetical protein
MKMDATLPKSGGVEVFLTADDLERIRRWGAQRETWPHNTREDLALIAQVADAQRQLHADLDELDAARAEDEDRKGERDGG